jgi:chromosome segregation ATPase
MVEPIMFFGIGFLVASLFGLVFIPLVHGRAVRLTMRRLEASTPVSVAEIQADKDQLRAEFAMSNRRLEMTVEQLKAKTASQAAELGKKTDAINRLKAELDEKAAMIVAFEARERAMQDQLRALGEEHSVKHAGMRDAEIALADKEAELAKIAHDLAERSLTSDSQRVEIVALRTQIDALKAQVEHDQHQLTAQTADAKARLAEANEECARAQRELAALRKEAEEIWAAERVDSAVLRERINDIAADVARLTLALEGPASPIQSMLDADTAQVRPNGGAHGNGEGRDRTESGGTLADRIRALQSRVARFPSSSRGPAKVEGR